MIEVKECSKAFGTVKAVNKATLDVGCGKCLVLWAVTAPGKAPCFG